MKPLQLFLVAVLLLSGARWAAPAFLESFTTNPEVTSPNFNKAAPFLWVQLGKVVPGGRGPTDTSQPTAGNALTFSQDNPASETVLMNWDAENTTQLTFYIYAEISSSCEPHVGLLKALWSNDSLTWQHMYNRTTAQMARNHYKPVRIALPPASRLAPIGFKWVYSTTSQCSSSWATIYVDDITFLTIPPSADTAMIAPPPKAPLMPRSPSLSMAFAWHLRSE